MELNKHQIEQIETLSKQLLKNANDDRQAILTLRESVIKTLDEYLFPPQEDALRHDFISSEEALLEVVDERTHTLFRRRLPLHFEENANALRLVGEDLNAKPSEIAFLTELGMMRLKELQGGGESEPRCDSHK